VCQGWRSSSGVFQAGFCFGGLFNLHVAKLLGVKDLATILALDIFGVIMPGNYAYPGVSAGGCHRSWCCWEKSTLAPDCIGIFPYLKTLSDDFFYLFGIFRGLKNNFRPGLVIPTEMVVY
jgi:hypothetical protein